MSEPNVNLTAVALECVRDGRTLFSELSIVVAAGELLMLEGANGSGKTSLLRILSGIRTPDSGKLPGAARIYMSWVRNTTSTSPTSATRTV